MSGCTFESNMFLTLCILGAKKTSTNGHNVLDFSFNGVLHGNAARLNDVILLYISKAQSQLELKNDER